jgi:hypothetical protein
MQAGLSSGKTKDQVGKIATDWINEHSPPADTFFDRWTTEQFEALKVHVEK